MNIAISLVTSARAPRRDAIRVEYAAFVQALGLIPVLMPTNIVDLGAYWDALHIAGLLLTGGGDIDPARYGQPNTHSEDIVPARDAAEWALLDLALARGVPVLGICRGFQLLNVYFGGPLIQDLPSALGTPIDHTTEGATHPVQIVDPRLVRALGTAQILTNTHHHQGITRAELAPALQVFALSPADGVIEGILHPTRPVLGVQWHPERADCPDCTIDPLLFGRFLREGAFWAHGA